MLARNLLDTVTLWVSTGTDDYGGYTFAAPITICGRWEQVREKFVDESGDETVSLAAVHVDRDVTVEDWIALGDFTSTFDPTTLEGDAYRIRNYSSITNLRRSQVNRKIFL